MKNKYTNYLNRLVVHRLESKFQIPYLIWFERIIRDH